MLLERAISELKLAINRNKDYETHKKSKHTQRALRVLGSSHKKLESYTKTEIDNIVLAFQILIGLSSDKKRQVLLDSQELYDMIVLYLSPPWDDTSISQLAFGLIYNLLIVNRNRVPSFVKSGGIPALVGFLKSLKKMKPSNLEMNVNLLLSALYIIGGVGAGFEEEFVKQGGLLAVMEAAQNVDHPLIFLGSFIHEKNRPETRKYLVESDLFKSLLDFKTCKQNRSELIIVILRNLSLAPDTSRFLLDQLLKGYEFLNSVSELDNLLSTMSNLIVTNCDMDFYSYLISPVSTIFLQKMIDLWKLYEDRERNCLTITTSDEKSENQNLENKSTIIEKKTSFWIRLTQFLWNKTARPIVSKAPFSFVNLLLNLAHLSQHIIESKSQFGKMVSAYMYERDLPLMWDSSWEGIVVDQNNILIPDEYYRDEEFSFSSLCVANDLDTNVCIMWKRIKIISHGEKHADSKNHRTYSPEIKFIKYELSQGPLKDFSLVAVIIAILESLYDQYEHLNISSSEPVNFKLFKDGILNVVTVDTYVPCYIWGIAIGVVAPDDPRLNFLLLLEKACAKLVGGYSQLVKLSIPEAYSLLTGKKAKLLEDINESKLFSTLSELLENNIPILISRDDSSILILDKIAKTQQENVKINVYDPLLPRNGVYEIALTSEFNFKFYALE